MLTSADVEQKTFSTALRGYDLDEVDDFLDEVVATIREMSDQLEEARTAAGEATSIVAPVPPPPAATEPETEVTEAPEPDEEAPPVAGVDESAIGRALLAAQQAADQLLEDARSRADTIVEEAKTEADSWSAEREAKRREAEAEMARLTTRVASIRAELSVLATEVSGKLDEMDDVIDMADTGTGPVDTTEDQTGEAGVAESPEDEPDYLGSDEESAPDVSADTAEGTSHLDEMLSGVVNDLRLSDEPNPPHTPDFATDDEDSETESDGGPDDDPTGDSTGEADSGPDDGSDGDADREY